MRRTRNAKIVATLGPASSSEDMVRRGRIDPSFSQFTSGARLHIRVLGRGDQEVAMGFPRFDGHFLEYCLPSKVSGKPGLAQTRFILDYVNSWKPKDWTAQALSCAARRSEPPLSSAPGDLSLGARPAPNR